MHLNWNTKCVRVVVEEMHVDCLLNVIVYSTIPLYHRVDRVCVPYSVSTCLSILYLK